MWFNRRQAVFLLLAGGIAASVSFGLGVVAQENWQAGSRDGLREAAIEVAYAANKDLGQAVISPAAAELLRAAALDSQGQIYVTETAALYEGKRQRIPTSTLYIRSFDKELCRETAPRIRAQWRAVIGELVSLGYIETAAADSSRATYRMTLPGYEAADRLPTTTARR